MAAFVISGIISLQFAYQVLSGYDARGTKTLAYAFAGVGLWAFNSAARTLVSDYELTLFLLSTELFFVIAIARIWFIFAAQYTNQEIHRSRWVQLALQLFVAAGIVLAFTNAWHGLMWQSITVVEEPFVHYAIEKGLAHYVFTLAAYGLVAGGMVFLLRMLRSTSHTKAIVALLLGFLSLVSVNAAPYLVDTTITHSTTITPLGATAFVFLTAIAIRHNLFSVTPIARDRVFEAMDDPVVLLDRNQHVIDHNPAFAAAFTDGEDVMHTELSEASSGLAEKLSLPLSGSRYMEYPDDEDRTYTVTESPIESGPHLLGHVLVFRDITDLVTSQWELARKDSQLDEFTDSVAHELRNPLSVMLAHADLLRTHLKQFDGGEVEYDNHLSINSLEQIEKHGERIKLMIDDFIKVSREAKTLQDTEPLDFGNLVRKAANDHIPFGSIAIPEDGELHASPPHARLLLDTVFRNIAHRGDENVTVTAQLTEGGFSIEDTGESVPETEIDNLLEYGYTTQYRSGGLGLSVAKTVAEAHQWNISIDTDYQDGLRVVVENATTTVQPPEESDPSEAEL